jgi:hypothetical protein
VARAEKPGLLATAAGASVRLELLPNRSVADELVRPWVRLSYLVSYAHQGRVRVSCHGFCTCTEHELDGHSVRAAPHTRPRRVADGWQTAGWPKKILLTVGASRARFVQTTHHESVVVTHDFDLRFVDPTRGGGGATSSGPASSVAAHADRKQTDARPRAEACVVGLKVLKKTSSGEHEFKISQVAVGDTPTSRNGTGGFACRVDAR